MVYHILNKRGIGLKKDRYYLSLSRDPDDRDYFEVHFINDTENHIKELILDTGSFATVGDDVVQTEPYTFKVTDIEPRGYVRIESLDVYDFDFVIQYNFKIITDDNIENITFSIGKRVGFLGSEIPILGRFGRRIFGH